MAMRRWPALVLFAALGGCRQAPLAPIALRLADAYKAELVEGRATGPAAEIPRTEWRFDGPAPTGLPAASSATRGWEAGPGVSGLTVREGRLEGRAASTFPILHLERKSGLEDRDTLHEVQVRLRISAGGDLAVGFRDTEKLDLQQVLAQAREFPWRLHTPVVPGEEIRTYTMRSPFAIPSPGIRHVLLRPTNEKGARFEIESVRLVFRREHLASLPSGVGWQGLSEVYREALVMRSPETLRLSVALPPRPRLELALGTLEEGPLTFRVGVRPNRPADPKDEAVLLERTVTTPHRWDPVTVDLERFAGREVALSLSLVSEKAGSLGLWGGPTVRSQGALPPSARTAGGAAPRPQGVILIWTDTLRRDHVGVYGYKRPTTPVIDRLAAEGTLFTDALVQATWTKVSTPSLLTSLYPASHGVHDFSDRLPGSATTLAEVYRQAGYATFCMSSVLFVGRFTNLHQGFEELHEDGSLPDRESSKTTRDYVDRLLPWLEVHREVPFFVLLHVTDPHDPYRPRPPYDTLFADAAGAEEHERHAKEVRSFIADPLMKRFGMPTREEMVKAKIDPERYVEFDRDWYDGSIRGMDTEIGRLIERLRGLGLAEKTLVVFTSDHGEEFLEHGRMFHGQTAYGELANVPLILWGAGVPKGAVVDDTVRIIDLYPTLLEMSGLPVPPGAQGRPLMPLLSSATARPLPDEPAITEKAATYEDVGGPPPRDTESFAMVAGGWKLIHNTKRPRGGPEFELYDHGRDPLNRTDVAVQHPDVVERLAKEIEAWRKMTAAARLKPDSEAAKALSADELERLRALGYIQ